MEVQVGQRVVLLTTHKTFRDDGEGGLRAVSNYGPFRRYVSVCEECGPVPSAFIVRNIKRIAQRIVGLIMDVECETRSGKIVQTVDLCDCPPVIILPVASVNDVRYAILVRERRVSIGCNFDVEAACGVEDDDGKIVAPNDELFSSFGIDLQKAATLNSKLYSVGNEGTAPYKVYSLNVDISPEVLQILQTVQRDVEKSLLALPLDEVVSSVSDVKACLAASLLLVS